MHSTLHDRVTGVLRVRILSGNLAPGERLRQEEIAKQFSVSHIPVREALRQLNAEGLVTIEPHKGAVVAGLSRRELEEIVLLRQLLEGEMLAAAIPKFGRAEVARAQKALLAVNKNQNRNSYAARNWEFHSTLYLPADLPLTFGLVQRMHMIGERYLKLEQDLGKVNEQHQMILELVKNADVENAVALLRAHIGELKERVSIVGPGAVAG